MSYGDGAGSVWGSSPRKRGRRSSKGWCVRAVHACAGRLMGSVVWRSSSIAFSPIPRACPREGGGERRAAARRMERGHCDRDRRPVTLVADREGDLYPLWALVRERGILGLGGIPHDRSLVGGGTLSRVARQWPLAGTRRMTLRERPGRPEREARLELRFGVVT